MIKPMILLGVVVTMVTRGGAQTSCITVPGVTPEAFVMPGDVMIGVLTFGHDYSTTAPCAETITSSSLFQSSTAISYGLNVVNNDTKLLPNITLGHVITGDCFKPQVSLARAVGFVPPGLCNTTGNVSYYDVVGVIGISTSSSAIVYGNFLNLFKVPMVGAVSTAEVLSDKSLFEYFVRVIPSDRYQAIAMVSLLVRYNWTYVSTIHSEGSYGQDGIKAVHQIAEEEGICVAYSKEIRRGADAEFFDEVVKGLIQNQNARVVLLFTQTQDGVEVLKALTRADMAGHFVFIASDGMGLGYDITGLEKASMGIFTLAPYAVPIENYRQFFGEISAANYPNPWLKTLISTYFGCSWSEKAPFFKRCDPELKIKDTPFFSDSFLTPVTVDSLMALVYALHNYISSKCPAAFKDKSLLKSCIKRHELLPFLYNATFPSSTGEMLSFDEKGDAEGKYQINQMQILEDESIAPVPVGFWDKLTFSLNIDKPLVWSNEQLRSNNDSSTPESVCSKPCSAGEFLVQLELKCCWECRKCRNNEVVVRNGSACSECPLLTWPNQVDFLTCEPIEPTYLKWSEPQTLTCLVLATLGLLLSAIIIVLNHKYRHERLIKATSRELSMITLSGVVLSYAASIVLILKPIAVSCYAGRIGFNMSFAIAYAPLLAKVTRIYRIFAAAKLGTKAPSFVSTRSQIIFSSALISIQVVLSVVSVILDPPDVQLRMPMTSEPFVEMLCALPLSAVMYPLAYNLVLMVACSALAFKARKLPDNFNESRFIFLCVCTTLFLWIAFIPSYFSAFYAAQKILLLSCVLLLNSAVLLMCLYIPRIYAVLYLDETKQGVKAAATGQQVGTTNGGMAPASESSSGK